MFINIGTDLIVNHDYHLQVTLDKYRTINYMCKQYIDISIIID